jgi:uridine kinase
LSVAGEDHVWIGDGDYHPLTGVPNFEAVQLQPSDVATPDAQQQVAAQLVSHLAKYPAVQAVVGMVGAAGGNTKLLVASRGDALEGSALQGGWQLLQHLASSPSIKAAAQAHPQPYAPWQIIDQGGQVMSAELPGAQTEASLAAAFNEGGKPNQRAMVQNMISGLPQDRRVAVLIGGPSGAGKSSLIEDIKKMAGDRKVVVLSGDMYFKDVDDPNFPKTPTGSWYFDDVKAMDMDRFKNDIAQLISTGQADVPVYNFKDVRPGGWHIPGVTVTGYREDKPEHLEIGPNDLLVIDSLHSTNPMIVDKLQSVGLDHASVYLDSEKADDRLLRRIVRDYATRSRSPQQTLSDWDNSTFPGEVHFVRPTLAEIDPSRDVFLITKFNTDLGLSRPDIEHKVAVQKQYGVAPTYEAFATPDDQMPEYARTHPAGSAAA